MTRIEKLRMTLHMNKHFDFSEAFHQLDPLSVGYVLKQDFINYLQKQYYYPLERDLQGIMNFFDRDEDGKVTFSDFNYQLKPLLVVE